MPGVLAVEDNLVVVDFGGTTVEPLSKKRLAAILGKSTRWIEMRCREGMPALPLDNKGRRRFVLSEVNDWLESHGRSAANA